MANLDEAVTISIIGRDALSGPASVAAASLQKLQQAASESAGVFGRLFGSVNQGIGLAAGFAIFDHLGDMLSAAGGAAIGFNQQIDAARASMGKFFDGTQSLNNSLANLQDLANKTPFQFPALVTAQQRTIAVAHSAEELKTNLDAITVAAASSGRVSGENFDRISLALGQIATKGKVQGDELLQLNEAGVNAAQMLADYFHTSTGAVSKMVQDGKVSSQDMFAALRQYAADPRNRQALDGLATTFEGAMSTIKDVVTSTTAAAFRPLFDLLTDGANVVANFLQGDQFKAWGEAVRLGFEAAATGIKSFLDGLAPIGQAISTAFGQATQGDFGAAFTTISAGFSEQLSLIGASISTFAHGMFGAGADLIGEFANGILQGGVQAVQGAIDAVASVIASFLVGNSPPPAGPLSTIDQAGQTLMETYGAGMQQGLGPAKAAVEAVDDQIRGISRSLADVDFEQTGLKNTVDDLKRGYEDMLHPLEDQLKLIEQQRQAGERALTLQFQQRELSLREAELDAKGDPAKRAEILGQIELLKQRQQELGLQDSLAGVERDKAKLAEDGKKSQLEDLTYTRQRHDLEHRLKDAKDKSQKESIQGQIQELDLRHKISGDQRTADQAAAERKGKELDLRRQEIQRQQELAGLTDKSKLAEIARDREILGVDKERAGIEQTRRQIELDRQKDVVLAEVMAVKDQEQQRLAPLQEQARLIERQKQGLEEQRKLLQLQKGDLQDIVQGLQAAEKAGKEAAKAGAGIGSGPGIPAGGIHFDLTAAQKDAEDKVKAWGATLATKISEGFKEHGVQILEVGIGAVLGGLAFGPLGAIVGGALAPSIWASVNERLKAAGFDASPVLARIVEGVKADNWAIVGEALWNGLQGAWEAGWKLFTRLDNALTLWLNAQIEHIEWDRLGTAFGKAIGEWLTGSAQDGADQAGDDIVRLDTGSLSRGISTFFNKALDAAWEAILGHWRDQEPGSGYGKVFVDGLDAAGWVGALHAVDVKLLEEWNAHRQADYDSLVAWNQKKTDELVRAYADWHVRQQGVIDDLVAQWNEHRKTDAERWNAWTADIGERLSKAWGTISEQAGTAWGSVRDAIGAKLTEIGTSFTNAIPTWIQAGSDLIQGIQTGINNALSSFWNWLQTNLVDQIPQFIRDILNLQADTGAMAMVGERMVQELEIGIQNRWPSLEKILSRLSGRLSSFANVDVDSVLQAAMDYTGVGSGWLPGLRWIVEHESSGDAGAKNPESTASGLFQLLDTTWAGYRDASLPDDVFNPLANAVAGIRYIMSRYDTPDKAVDFWKANNYYADGGWINEPVLGHGLRSGESYMFGEAGSELVVPHGQIRSGNGGGINEDSLAKKIAAELAVVLPRRGDINIHGAGTEDVVNAVRQIVRGEDLMTGVRR